jgi:hypothetical protein
MKRDTRRTTPITSSFLSCEKDTETILRKLFIESKPYSNVLKRLLVVQAKDCLDNEAYDAEIENISIAQLRKNGYIVLEPKIKMQEHEQVKAYIIISFDNFTPNAKNPEFRDCTVNFDILCHPDYWDIGEFRMRPLKIAGYIDGLLNNCKLSGIGTFNFMGCDEIVVNPELSGYILSYWAVHGSDDQIESPEDEE